MTESCTQVEVRYYLQCLTTSNQWRNYPQFPRGFKTERSATRLLKKMDDTECRIVKQITIIEIKTTTEEEVLGVV